MNKIKTTKLLLFLIAFTILSSTNLYAHSNKPEYAEPNVIQPGKKGKAPSDAIILFEKGTMDNFVSVKDGSPANWKVSGKKFTVNPESTDIQTKQSFGSCQLHIEWRSPIKDIKEGKEEQNCGNSGVYFMGKYEIQVLNSYQNDTYADGQAGAVYRTHPPLVNASLKPGKWQTYDIIFTAPKFDDEGYIEAPGYFTVFHNGVLVQNHKPTGRPTQGFNETTPRDAAKLPLMLQNHGSEVSYRNIWIREL